MKDTKHKHEVITCINQTECSCIETKIINLRSLDQMFKNFIYFFALLFNFLRMCGLPSDGKLTRNSRHLSSL